MTWGREDRRGNNHVNPALLWALSRSLPGPEETFLLKALLHRSDSARRAWAEFSSRVPDLPSLFRTDTGGRKRLSPLLLEATRENGLEADPGLLTVLRTAYLREELRAKAYRRIASGVYEALEARKVPFLVIKGAALSETVFPHPSLRHSHDVDIVLARDRLGEAEDAMDGLGLQRAESLPGAGGSRFRHSTDLPVLLRMGAFQSPFYRTDFPSLWNRSRVVELEEGPRVRVPGSADSLLHAVGHASYCPNRSTLVWATDAWMILHGPDGVDWSAFAAATKEARLEIPAYVMLHYLARELEAPIPDEALARSGELAASAGRLRRDVALYGARQARGRHPELTRRADGAWGMRVRLLLWQLFPSREYLRWAYGPSGAFLAPALYLIRPLSYAANVLKWKVLRYLRR